MTRSSKNSSRNTSSAFTRSSWSKKTRYHHLKQEVKYELARNKSIILAFFKILKNFHVFEFETRKRLIVIFKELAKLKDYNNKSDMLTSFSTQTNLDELVRGLVDASKCNDQVLGCAGQVLKLFAKSKVRFILI